MNSNKLWKWVTTALIWVFLGLFAAFTYGKIQTAVLAVIVLCGAVFVAPRVASWVAGTSSST